MQRQEHYVLSAALFAVVLALLLLLVPGRAFAAAPTDVERGNALIRSKGCAACHSMDGTARVGPTFRGMWGRTRPILTPPQNDPQNVVIDEAYLGRSLRNPDGEIAVGYPRGNMPRFDLSDEDVHAIAAALHDVESAPGNVEASGKRGGSIVPLVIAAAAFAGLHFFLSSLPVRKRLIGAMKEGPFSGIYSLLALASFGAMIWFYRSAPYIEVWSPPRFTRWIPLLAMPLAILFMVAGFSTPGPTAVAQGAKAAEDPKGIQAVTRHPALWGFATWAIAHLSTNGELHVILVALSILTLAIGGMLHIDSRRKHALGETWTTYTEKTSIVPFVAIAQGRAKLRLGEIGIMRILITVLAYFAVLHTHALVIGASPFP